MTLIVAPDDPNLTFPVFSSEFLLFVPGTIHPQPRIGYITIVPVQVPHQLLVGLGYLHVSQPAGWNKNLYLYYHFLGPFQMLSTVILTELTQNVLEVVRWSKTGTTKQVNVGIKRFGIYPTAKEVMCIERDLISNPYLAMILISRFKSKSQLLHSLESV